MSIPFLTAFWKNLVVINFEVDPRMLRKYMPRGTTLDLFDNKAYVSLVAFRFNENRLFGLFPSLPAYSFEEINLRFYIKREDKRAVAFVKEVVPSRLIATTARVLYQEPYISLNTYSSVSEKENSMEYVYYWGKDLENKIHVEAEKSFSDIKDGSFEEFILEHYWGYTAQKDASTVEYQVKHPRWRYRQVFNVRISDEVKNFYGDDFKQILSNKPASVFVAEGSKISVSIPYKFFHPLESTDPKGWVLYDGICGFCSWWIPFWKKTIQKTGYDIAPVQAEWIKEKIGLREEELNNDIRLLLNDGSLIDGADAYIYGMKKVWWSFPFGLVLGLPVFRQITWKFYKMFNRNRFIVSRICRLKPEIY